MVVMSLEKYAELMCPESFEPKPIAIFKKIDAQNKVAIPQKE
jgi:hypothetical protein